eukprot:772185-Pelagomonas_calceolata.AAC.1
MLPASRAASNCTGFSKYLWRSGSREGYLRPKISHVLHAPRMCPITGCFQVWVPLVAWLPIAQGFQSSQLREACLISRGVNPTF